MASQFTLQYVAQDYPQPLLVGLIGSVDGRIEVVRHAPMHEPHSVAAIKRSASMLCGLWFEPELGDDGCQALEAYYESITVRSAT